ncbi:MAG TPA: hypothetical protein VMI35_13730 [Puia sp.]|nr:hypothetical protein [Puia sp.]
MKKIVQISTVLSWFNLIMGSFLVLAGLFMALASQQMLSILTSLLLVSSIILHSYAALQLRKSILHPEIPLNRQTPTGIRFMGFIALFCSLLIAGNAFFILQHAGEVLQQMSLPPEAKSLNMPRLLKGTAVFTLIFALSILTNVVLNMRLLRWYLSIPYENKE